MSITDVTWLVTDVTIPEEKRKELQDLHKFRTNEMGFSVRASA
jgi:hypothetical protein